MTKCAVAYFSASGVTANTASQLAELLKAELFEITPETKYTPEDLDWRNSESRSSVEMKDPSCRPALVPGEYKLDADVVFVGFPVWWGREPSVVDTFLDAADFSGKIVVPFCTSGGSPVDGSTANIRKVVGDTVKVAEGRRLGTELNADEIAAWVKELGL